MKKLWSLLLIVFALCGCVGSPTKANKKFSNVQQENFDNMLARNRDKSYRLGNKILENSTGEKFGNIQYRMSIKIYCCIKIKFPECDFYIIFTQEGVFF